MGAAFCLVPADAQGARGVATIWIGRRTAHGTDGWRWEVLRVLWQAMGTINTAAWVADHYGRRHPDATTAIPSAALAEAVRLALGRAEVYYPTTQ